MKKINKPQDKKQPKHTELVKVTNKQGKTFLRKQEVGTNKNINWEGVEEVLLSIPMEKRDKEWNERWAELRKNTKSPVSPIQEKFKKTANILDKIKQKQEESKNVKHLSAQDILNLKYEDIKKMKSSDLRLPPVSELNDMKIVDLYELGNKFTHKASQMHLNTSDASELLGMKKEIDRLWEESFQVNTIIRKKLEKNEKAIERTQQDVQTKEGESVKFNVVKKEGGKYNKSGVRTLEWNGVKQGEQVEFKAGGKTLVGEFRHMNKNVHSPNGYIVIRHEKKLYERKPELVTPVKGKTKK